MGIMFFLICTGTVHRDNVFPYLYWHYIDNELSSTVMDKSWLCLAENQKLISRQSDRQNIAQSYTNTGVVVTMQF